MRGREQAFGGEWVVGSAGGRRRCVGVRKCSGRACRCAGTGDGLRRGMGGEVGEECIAQPAGVRRRCVGERKCSAVRVVVRGRAKVFGGEWVVRSARNASRSLRACIVAARGSGSVREGGEKMLGQGASLCGGGRRSSVGNGL